MPQMMPMKWLLMIIFLTTIIMMIISFVYFLMKYQTSNPPTFNIKYPSWNWKW